MQVGQQLYLRRLTADPFAFGEVLVSLGDHLHHGQARVGCHLTFVDAPVLDHRCAPVSRTSDVQVQAKALYGYLSSSFPRALPLGVITAPEKRSKVHPLITEVICFPGRGPSLSSKAGHCP